jgi:EAL domain-containing protein (putative c-di-GMP-specific phosphodiesterase class I)
VAQQIYRGQLVKDIDYALKKYNISGDMLELELTESSLFDKSEEVNFLLQQLKDRHISISLDDFGTGYSSLAYLTSYPFDILKIDRAFISKIGQEKDEAIVNAIIAMGNAIGITLVAEGVETKEQALFLQKHGCYILQGFYFSKALSSADSTKYLEQHKLIKIC